MEQKKLQKQQSNFGNIRSGRVNIAGKFIANSNAPLFEERQWKWRNSICQEKSSIRHIQKVILFNSLFFE